MVYYCCADCNIVLGWKDLEIQYLKDEKEKLVKENQKLIDGIGEMEKQMNQDLSKDSKDDKNGSNKGECYRLTFLVRLNNPFTYPYLNHYLLFH